MWQVKILLMINSLVSINSFIGERPKVHSGMSRSFKSRPWTKELYGEGEDTGSKEAQYRANSFSDHQGPKKSTYLTANSSALTPSQLRNRSPEASVNGMPVTCTLVPGAWLASRMRALDEGLSTGRGWCGSGRPAGLSTQMRQTRTLAVKLSSSSLILAGHILRRQRSAGLKSRCANAAR